MEQFLKNRIVTGFDLLHVSVGTEFLFALLKHGDGNIGAMVGNSFITVECISKDESTLQGASAVLKPADMVFPASSLRR